MGTNYYVDEEECPYCLRADAPLHIGKSSCGWVFALHVYPDWGLLTWGDMLCYVRALVAAGRRLRDEYDRDITVDELINIVTNRCTDRNEPLTERWMAENDACRGPHGLARARIDGRSCIGHGEGTYDYHVGDFS